MKANVYIGPAGWSYPDWAGIVYPARKPRAFDPLAHLASYFNLIEINNTFYRIPRRSTCADWVGRVDANPGLLFTVKAPRDFTHRPGTPANREINAFTSGVEPIFDAGRLGAVLFQFPWSFRMTPEATGKIKDLVDAIAPMPAAVEVRHATWAGDAAAVFFRNSAVPLCGIDQPVIGQSLTADTYLPGRAGAYFRLHGRNRKHWFDRSAGRDQRYDYLYSESELAEWRERVRSASDGVERVFVVLNNHFRGQAVANALQLDAMLSGKKSRAPAGVIAAHPKTGKLLTPAAPEPHSSGDVRLPLFEDENEKKNGDDPGGHP